MLKTSYQLPWPPQDRTTQDSIEYEALVKSFFLEAFREERLTPEDLFADRLITAWRVVRLFAETLRVIQPGDPLPPELPEPIPSPPRERHRRAPHVFMAEVRIPSWLPDGPDPSEYRKALETALELLRAPTRGRRYLFEHFPSYQQILEAEGVLETETFHHLLDRGAVETVKTLEIKYGIPAGETPALLRQARARAQGLTLADNEDERALMVLRLESTAARAKDNLDLRAELAALKQTAIVQGLAKLEQNDPMRDFLDVVRTVSSSRRPALPLEEGGDP